MRRLLIFAVLAACLFLPPSAAAQEVDKPTFYLGMYGWLASVNGIAVTDGGETVIEIPFSELVERSAGGFQLYAETRWEGWLFGFDGTWATLEGAGDVDSVNIAIKVEQRLFDIRAGRQMQTWVLSTPEGAIRNREVSWDLFAGARYFRTATTLDITPVKVSPASDVAIDVRWDPFVGAAIRFDLLPRLAFSVRGDLGGFGIGDAALFTWQSELKARFYATEWLSIHGGYRWLTFDTVTGTGESRNGVDLMQRGPIIGGGLHF